MYLSLPHHPSPFFFQKPPGAAIMDNAGCLPWTKISPKTPCSIYINIR